VNRPRLHPLLALVFVVACSEAPDSARPTPSEPTTPQSTPEPAPRAAPIAQPPRDKAEVAGRIVDPKALEGWTIQLAYDLGTLQLAVIHRLDHPGTISLVRAAAPTAAPVEDFQAAFGGAPFQGKTHPLELLGYDLIQPTAHGVDPSAGGGSVPWLSFAWMRQDTDATLERGIGTAHWVRCPDDQSIVLVGAEGTSTGHDPETARRFAIGLAPCATRN